MKCVCCRYQGQDPGRKVRMVLMLRQCCCGCSLKTGSSIISISDAVSIQLTQISPTHRPPLPPGNITGTHFCKRLSHPQDHSAAGRIMSMKNSNDNIGNRTRDLPACSAVPQPTEPLRAPVTTVGL